MSGISTRSWLPWTKASRRLGPARLPVDAPSVVPAPEPEPPILDQATLDEFIEEMGRDCARKIVDVFLTDTQGRIERMRNTAEDRSLLEVEAHSMKSSSAMLGLMALS